jgi:hypothetical protein
MREGLQKIHGKRAKFIGTFTRYGSKKGWKGRRMTTVLLTGIVQVQSTQQHFHATDHLWFNLTKEFEALGELKAGDKVCFEARSATYKKGYAGERTTDYRLSHPTKFSATKSKQKNELFN